MLGLDRKRSAAVLRLRWRGVGDWICCVEKLMTDIVLGIMCALAVVGQVAAIVLFYKSK